ncbi:hypothetical protein HQ584_11760 [Patescibacteria group bacterium]|nr:hypothetical protein [Patescibacteria group bacterium]
MSLVSITLPILALVFGLISLYMDPKKQKSLALGIITSLLFLICSFAIFNNYQENKKAEAEKVENEKDIKFLKDRLVEQGTVLTNLSSLTKTFQSETKKSLDEINGLLTAGWSIERVREEASKWGSFLKAVETTKEADKERSKISATSSKVSRQSITVQYFPKNVDKNIVESALKELGFKLIRGRANFPAYPTNAIWFGANVKIEDVKLVAFTLIRAGVRLNVISPFRERKGTRSNLIQVGTYVKYLNSPLLNISEIKNAKLFIRAD